MKHKRYLVYKPLIFRGLLFLLLILFLMKNPFIFSIASDDSFQDFLELFFTYWPIGLGIIVLILTIIICWIGCHFTKEDNKKKKAAAAVGASRAARDVRRGRKKKGRRGSDDSDVELGKT